MKREIRLVPTGSTREAGQVHQLRQSFILRGDCAAIVYIVLLEMPYNNRDMAYQELTMIQSESLYIHAPRQSRMSYDVETCEFYDVCYLIPSSVALMEELYLVMVTQGSEGIFVSMENILIQMFGEEKAQVDDADGQGERVKRILEI